MFGEGGYGGKALAKLAPTRGKCAKASPSQPPARPGGRPRSFRTVAQHSRVSALSSDRVSALTPASPPPPCSLRYLPRGFRHEKTKAKRSTYRGGLIDTNAVNSVKFDNDDD